MMILVGRADLRIDAAPARVWERLADVAAWKTWMPGVRWAVLEGELVRGAYVTIRPLRGRQTAYRVDAAAAPLVLSLGLTFGPVAALRHSFTLEPHGTGTRVVHTVEIAGPLRRWLAAGTAARIHAAAPAVLEALAAAL
jgi:carbon monoxide dehydrogenase subunit G